MRRSLSPPTSASTLSSSFNNGSSGGRGGGNSTENTTTATATAREKVVTPLNERKDEWATELQPIPSGLEIVSTGERCGLGLEEWENMLSEPNQEQSLLRWISGDVDESFGFRQLLQNGGNNNSADFDSGGLGLGMVDGMAGISSIGTNLSGFSASGFSSTNSSSSSNVNGNGKVNYASVGLGNNSSSNCSVQNPIFGALPPGMVYHHRQIEASEEKPQILNPQVMMNQHQSQNANTFMQFPFPQQNQLLQHETKRHNSGGMGPIMPQMIAKHPFGDPGHEILARKQQQQQHFQQGVNFVSPHMQQNAMVVKKEEQQHALLDQLYKAAELVGTGNFSHAQGILARLNQQLSPIGKPLYRAAFYFKEALQLLILMNNNNNNNSVTLLPPRSPTAFDVIFKIGAYKIFSEVSPLIQFVNFTSNQALLESLRDEDRIHIIDFDIGFGAQWASFMQELPRSRGTPLLKITAFASPSTHHPVEILLMRENLTQFANEIGISFELDVINFDSLEQSCYSLPIYRSSDNEAIAVNFPVWSCSNQPSALPSLLRFIKHLSPKIVVCLDRGERIDLPFPQHILHSLQAHIHLLESLDAANAASDAVNKIEKFLLQPRIESTVFGRLRAPEKMPTWKTMFASAGFSPVMFSNFTETQAEYVMKRIPVRGFHVEKRQALLVLCWQRRDLMSASAWRC
ncbi:scarecrow-like protein 6 isoform X2 [Mercurialis annua]|nr:scarecrow-like protein 6 isoform X2 [Mercurialis annua]